MILIEFIKDTKDKRPNRTGTIPKGKRLKVTKEIAELFSKSVKDVSNEMEEFEKEVFEKNNK